MEIIEDWERSTLRGERIDYIELLTVAAELLVCPIHDQKTGTRSENPPSRPDSHILDVSSIRNRIGSYKSDNESLLSMEWRVC